MKDIGKMLDRVLETNDPGSFMAAIAAVVDDGFQVELRVLQIPGDDKPPVLIASRKWRARTGD